MRSVPPNKYIEVYGDTEFKVTPYTMTKLGIANNQSTLKIQDYHINAAPYLMSINKMTLLGVLSASEIDFFKKFEKTLATLTLRFSLPGGRTPELVPIRSKITSVTGLANKENICLFTLSISSCPKQVVRSIGDHLNHIRDLGHIYSKYESKFIPVTKESVAALGYNNYAEISLGGSPLHFRITHLGVSRLKANIPRSEKEIQELGEIKGKLFFRKYRIEVTLRLHTTEKIGDHLTSATYRFEKNLPYLEILENYLLEKGETLPDTPVPIPSDQEEPAPGEEPEIEG